MVSLFRHSGLDPESSDVVLLPGKSLDTGFRRYDCKRPNRTSDLAHSSPNGDLAANEQFSMVLEF